MSRYYTTERTASYIEQTERLLGLEKTADSDLGRKRQTALENFSSLGFPTTKHEEWKYTNLRDFLAADFHRRDRQSVLDLEVEPQKFDALGFRSQTAVRLVFLNGHYREDLSTIGELPEGVVLTSLAEAIDAETEQVTASIANYPDAFRSPFTELNTALMQDGLFLSVPNGVAVERVIHLLYLVDGAQGDVACYPRNLIVAAPNSSVRILEEYRALTDGAAFTCAVTEVDVADGARVDHVKVQQESTETFHIASTYARLGRDSNYHNNAISFGGKIARNDPWADLTGEGGHAALDGLYIADGGQTLDAHTTIDHASANCTSHELYKGIMRENGHAVFNGKIFVREGAQKTDSKQSNMNLLLSDTAEINTKPQLEIFADDVRCTHGATIGRLDEDGLFYLRSRGIGAEQAQTIMTYAFAAEVIEHVENREIAEYVTTLLDQYLEH